VDDLVSVREGITMPKVDLAFRTPYLNAAGSLGFAPDRRGPVDLSMLGAFITNPISRRPRTPASPPRLQPHPGGFLLHSGYPNPGLEQAVKLYRRKWESADAPVIVHLLLGADERGGAQWLQEAVVRLEGMSNIAGLELGLPPDLAARAAKDWMIEAAQAAGGELPLIVRIPLERAHELAEVLPALAQAGAAAVSLGPPRGALPGGDGVIQGRVYGPGVYPLALAAVRRLAGGALPIIGAGGIYSRAQAEAMLSAGAMAVQLDAVLWRGGI
jgi:dihydroorotate dehydrogenase